MFLASIREEVKIFGPGAACEKTRIAVQVGAQRGSEDQIRLRFTGRWEDHFSVVLSYCRTFVLVMRRKVKNRRGFLHEVKKLLHYFYSQRKGNSEFSVGLRRPIYLPIFTLCRQLTEN